MELSDWVQIPIGTRINLMLSIIIIAKDEEKCLPRLLQSIKMQDFSDMEIIVSDADSIDDTARVARQYGCRVARGGYPSIGRNNGAKIAIGDIFLFLDADVVLPPNFLQKNLEEFIERDLAAATVEYVPMSEKITDKTLYKLYDIWAKSTQFFYPHSGGFCIFCKRDVFEKINGFNEKLLIAEDHDFVNRSAKFGKFRILKSMPILADVRRLEKEGRLNLTKKYVRGAAARMLRGELYEPPFEYELHGGVGVGKKPKKKK